MYITQFAQPTLLMKTAANTQRKSSLQSGAAEGDPLDTAAGQVQVAVAAVLEESLHHPGRGVVHSAGGGDLGLVAEDLGQHNDAAGCPGRGGGQVGGAAQRSAAKGAQSASSMAVTEGDVASHIVVLNVDDGQLRTCER